jgi:hypothetical protein
MGANQAPEWFASPSNLKQLAFRPLNLPTTTVPSSPHSTARNGNSSLTMIPVRYGRKLAMHSFLPLESAPEAKLAQRNIQPPESQGEATVAKDKQSVQAILPLDIWLVVASFFLSRATLCSLCLSSKGLSGIFTPVLYRTISSLSGYSRWEQKLKKMSELDSESHLRFTRHLEIGYSKFAPLVDPAVLRDLFEKMTHLKTCKIR